MDVYHDNNIWGKGSPETKLTALPVNHSFLWGEHKTPRDDSERHMSGM